MKTLDSAEVALSFVDCVNRQDVKGLAELMTRIEKGLVAEWRIYTDLDEIQEEVEGD